MSDKVVLAYISKQRAYVINCPECGQSETFHVTEIPPTRPNPFKYICPCGISSSVRLVGFRGGERKPVELVSSFVRATDPGKVRTLCTVLDISVKGMRVSAEPVKNLAAGEEIDISIILDDDQRTKLELPSKIQRLNQDNGQLTIAFEFLNLDPSSQGILGDYLKS